MIRIIALSVIATLVLSACGNSEPPAVKGPELVVYSSRIEQLIKPIFDDFTEETGISIRYVTDEAGPLLARLKAEGDNSPADMLITVDAGNLWHAAEMGILERVNSTVLNENIPPALRDEQGRWYGVSIRARTIVYATDRVKPEELAGYEDLAGPEWSGRLCLRTSKKVYNQSLVASMIVALGEEKAEQIVAGWVDNLAVSPFASDNKVIEAIDAGQCDVGLVNTYYLARMLVDQADLPVGLFWANQRGEGAASRGVHVNVSGAGITKASKNKENALRLLEWLSGPSAQYDFAHLNKEYPVNDKTAPSTLIEQWGSFRADTMPLTEAGRLQGAAIRLMDRVGYR
ncbi:putative binding protein component of ABC iron transporter [Zhongshania aliphaticivorans]|uniref:Putative binding protein component of ABC iron transporter n=1 Tax=Zhongshania aliphaticivorans TaxID=1470434 RepID=A0A5S9MTB4_9GAMM|nr:extracellular solute-binding protein [Zhongshania aliphaticivorans]CAA0079923.1 putative binding protein component of ABC iron transporter [Zhongshania aliphaticivorans]CAA0085966.1 putative binding protein component of ABC iron transporter [Zhongshania aliphaticivorans]